MNFQVRQHHHRHPRHGRLRHQSLRHKQAILDILKRLGLTKLRCKFDYCMSRRNKKHFFPFITISALEIIDAVYEVVKNDGWRIRDDIMENLEAGNI